MTTFKGRLFFCLLLTAPLHRLSIPLIVHPYLSANRPFLGANLTLNGNLDSFSTCRLLAFQYWGHTSIICFQITNEGESKVVRECHEMACICNGPHQHEDVRHWTRRDVRKSPPSKKCQLNDGASVWQGQ